MIAKARAISHGGNMERYSVNKWKAHLVKLNKIPEGLEATTMWKLMEATQLKFRGKLNAHRPLKNTAIRIEVSPSEAQSAGWKMDDWVKLTNDFIKAFDEVDLSRMAQRESAKSTNLRNSQYVVMLHEDSDSGIKHLHIVANRVDMEGNVNDDHCIHERAMIAAFRVSEERRWEQPQEVREGHIKIMSFDCKSALEDMESFSWEAYEAYLKAHGYGIEYRRDSDDKITGYTRRRSIRSRNRKKRRSPSSRFPRPRSGRRSPSGTGNTPSRFPKRCTITSRRMRLFRRIRCGRSRNTSSRLPCSCSPDTSTAPRLSPTTAAVRAAPLPTTGARRSPTRTTWPSPSAAWSGPSSSTSVLPEEDCIDKPLKRHAHEQQYTPQILRPR